MGRTGAGGVIHQAPGGSAPACSSSGQLPRATRALSVRCGQLLLSQGTGLPSICPPGTATSSVNTHSTGQARSDGFSPPKQNLIPLSGFKDKNRCIKRLNDSEGMGELICFFLHIISLAFLETMKLFSFFRHETWPQRPCLAIRRPRLPWGLREELILAPDLSSRHFSRPTWERAGLRNLQERMYLGWKKTLILKTSATPTTPWLPRFGGADVSPELTT